MYTYTLDAPLVIQAGNNDYADLSISLFTTRLYTFTTYRVIDTCIQWSIERKMNSSHFVS